MCPGNGAFPWGNCVYSLGREEGRAPSGDHASEGRPQRAREQSHNTHTYAYAHTHTPLYTHTHPHVHTTHAQTGQTCVNTSIHPCKHTRTHHTTIWQALTETLLRGASWAPRTWQREPRCQQLSSPESQFGEDQLKSWQGRETIPTIPRQVPRVIPSPSPCTSIW